MMINKNLIASNATLLIGLSGGPDSVYLLHQLAGLRKEKNLTLIAAHLDHEWRSESNNDAAFCQQLCTNLDIHCIVKKASELNFIPEKNGSKEDIGRQLRRYFFSTLMTHYDADAVALGHHQDDQVETFLIRLIRGSSLEGLCGIQERNGFYIRPLLYISKQTILTYLTEHNLSYVIDASNQSDIYLRNRIRHTALPALTGCDNRFTRKCIETIEHLQSAEDFLKEHTEEVYSQLCSANKETQQILNGKKLLTYHLYIQKRIIQLWLIKHNIQFNASDNFLEEILRFISTKKGGSHQLGTSWKIIKKQSMLSIYAI